MRGAITYKALRKAYILCGCLKPPGMAFSKFDVLFAFHAQAAFHTQAWARHVQADPRKDLLFAAAFLAGDLLEVEPSPVGLPKRRDPRLLRG